MGVLCCVMLVVAPFVCIHAGCVAADRAVGWQEVRIRCVVSAIGRCNSFLHQRCHAQYGVIEHC